MPNIFQVIIKYYIIFIGSKLKNLTDEEKMKLIRNQMAMPNKINRHRKRMSFDFYGNILNSIGGQNIATERDEENEEKMERMYEQRRRMNPLKKYIKANRNKYASNEEFYEKNKTYL